MKHWVQSLKGSKFLRQVAAVAAGTAGAQAIAMALTPLITRLYGPEAYGLLGAFMAAVMIVTPVSGLSFPGAIVLPSKDAHARGLVLVSVYTGVGTALLAVLTLLLGGQALAKLLGMGALGAYVYLLPVAMVFALFLQIAQQWAVRKKRFGQLAKVAVLHSIIVNMAKVGLGVMSPYATTLVGATLAGSALNAAMLSAGVSNPGAIRKSRAVSPRRLISLVRRYRDFPLYRAPQALLNAVSQSVPVLALASAFGPAVAGFYALSRTVMGVPSNLVGSAVGRVFYGKAADVYSAGTPLTPLLVKATCGLALIGIIPFALIVVFGPAIFQFVFGSEWAPAGEYARWIGVWLFFGFVNIPCNVSLPVLHMLRIFLVYEVASCAARFAALYLGFYLFKDPVVAIAIFSLVGVVVNLLLVAGVIFSAMRRDRALGIR